MSKNNCKECGSVKLEELPTRGPFVWKNHEAIYLGNSLTLLTCLDCKNHVLDDKESAKLEEALNEHVWENAGDNIKN